nr:HNH endonuclease [Bacillus subtilis]
MALRWSYKRREEFAELSARKCAHCGVEGLVSKREANGNESLTYNIDHIIPQASGGTDDIDNLQLLCSPCNGAKGALSTDEFSSHSERKYEVERMKVELEETTGLDIEYIERMLANLQYQGPSSRSIQAAKGRECMGVGRKMSRPSLNKTQYDTFRIWLRDNGYAPEHLRKANNVEMRRVIRQMDYWYDGFRIGSERRCIIAGLYAMRNRDF